MRRIIAHNHSTHLWFACAVRSVGFYTANRSVFSYGFYPTPAKGDLGPLPKNATEFEKIQQYESNIIYHGQWRSILFFLTLLAYHEQKRIVNIDKTYLQHGYGPFPGLHGCHTALFPTLIDFQPGEIKTKKSSIIHDSFLLHWNNMTVCCPETVNDVDAFFEGGNTPSMYRKNLLSIISYVSLGFHDPLIGLQMYYHIIEKACADSFAFIEKQETSDLKKAVTHAIALEREGMLEPINYNRIIERQPHERLFSAYARTQRKLLTGGANTANIYLQQFRDVELVTAGALMLAR